MKSKIKEQQHRRNKPLPNGSDGGRDACGRFAPGNAGGPGNPRARQVARLRSMLFEAVTEEDLKRIARKLMDLALAGNLHAIALIFAYLLGKPVPMDDAGDEPGGKPTQITIEFKDAEAPKEAVQK